MKCPKNHYCNAEEIIKCGLKCMKIPKEKQWYEVFISNEKGTRTLETFDTVEEARAFKEDLFRKIDDNEGTLHIDKWENIDNPKKIGEIE